MSITYKYYDDDIELSHQQAEMEYSSYDKYEFVDSKLKVIYNIKNGVIISGSYYLDNGENVADLITEYCVHNKWYFTFYTLLDTSEPYKLWKGNGYNEQGLLSSKWKQVLNDDGLEIAMCRLDNVTEDIRFGHKMFYDINPETGKKDVLVQFQYDQTNPFAAESFAGGRGEWDYYYGGAVIEKVYDPEVMAVFDYDSHPYYHNLLPLLPVNGVV